MDEYDVYMDSVNRRYATQTLLQFAMEFEHLQFVFLSPQVRRGRDGEEREGIGPGQGGKELSNRSERKVTRGDSGVWPGGEWEVSRGEGRKGGRKGELEQWAVVGRRGGKGVGLGAEGGGLKEEMGFWEEGPKRIGVVRVRGEIAKGWGVCRLKDWLSTSLGHGVSAILDINQAIQH